MMNALTLLMLSTMLTGAVPEEVDPDLRIGTITLQLDDVFPAVDGEEPSFPYSIANLLHIRTREEVVRRELLFAEGDPFRPELLAETERNLRRFRFLRHARVEAAEPDEDGYVEVRVHTIDSWTTKTQLNLGSSGGKLVGSGGLVEDNLLGTGRSVAAYYIVGSQRTSTRLQLTDPRLFGRFLTLTLAYSMGEDLQRLQTWLIRPFTSTLTTWSWGLLLDRNDAVEYLYAGGEESARFQQDRWLGEAYVARSFGSSPELVRRLRLGWRYTSEDFRPDADAPFSEELAQADQRFVGPAVALELRQMRYVREHNIRTAIRDEDYNLGGQLVAELGYYPEWLGSSRSAAGLAVTAAKGISFGPGHFALGSLQLTGRLEKDGVRNGALHVQAEYYHRIWERLTFAASVRADWLRNPDPERQILLGGEEGLRGYKLRLYSGDKGMLGRLEARVLLVEDLLKLCSVGVVAFADAGNAWGPGRGMDLLDQHVDFGGGVRIAFPRSSEARVMRFDLSYALDDNGLDSPWLISFGATQSF